MRIPSSSASRSPACGGAGRKKKAGSPTPCCSKVGLKRGPWTAEEDEVLSTYIRREGEGRWRTLPTRAGLLRCGKSCRLRWMNYLRPSVKRGHIAPDEEDLILRLHRLLGNRWSLIAGRIPGRTDNEIKNYWNTHLSKKLISQGIDPRTHKPLSPSNPNSPNIAAAGAGGGGGAAAVTPPHHEPSSSSTPSASTNPNSSPIDAAVLSSDHLPPGTPPFLDVALEYFNCPVLQDPGESPGPAGTDMVGFNRELEEEYCDISRGCADDAFSTFLNSLIKEDELVSAKYLQPDDEQHDVDDALLASNKGDALGMGMGMVSSSSARKAAATALASSSAIAS